jgi:hypothetical protein
MKKRYWIPGLLIIGGLTTGWLGPRLLIKAATEKPKTVGQFITAPATTPDLHQQMTQAIAGQSPPQAPETSSQLKTSSPRQQTSTHDQTLALSQTAPTETSQQTPTNSGSTHQTISPEQPASQSLTPTTRTETTSPSFALNMREQEIASMIYNGLYAGTAPPYRGSIQGVSVELQNGQGKITVALLPRYLPDHFLKTLPGVNRDTPTIYLGGSVGLSLNNNQVVPEIHSLALGSLSIPAPFIKAMVKYQVQQQVKQITQLESGQTAVLDAIEIANGSLSIRGHVAQ